jgi:hypothetical protein
MFIRSLQNPFLRSPEGDDTGGGGSGNDMEAMIRAAVERATSGLSQKNAELLNELKGERQRRTALESEIAQIGDTGDIAKAREIMEMMQQDTDLAMIARGGKPAFEEVLTRRTKSIITEERNKVEAATQALRAAEEQAAAAVNRWRSERLSNAVATAVAKAGAIPAAAEFLHMKAGSMFELDDESGTPRLRAELAKEAIDRNGNPLTLDTWVESARDTHPFFFGLPSGGGAGGNSRSADGKEPLRIDGRDSKAISNNLEAIAKGSVVLN